MWMNTHRKWLLGTCCPILVCLSSGAAYCHPQSDKAASKLTSLAQVLELAEQPEGQLDFRGVGAVLMALDPQTRKSAFNQLIRCRREGLAVFVADLAILDGDPEYASVIASAITSWHSFNQLGILHRILPLKDRFGDVPRALVRSVLKEGKGGDAAGSIDEPTGIAAILLASLGDQTDLRLVLDMVKIRPRSWGNWMAIAFYHLMDGPTVPLAKEVYQNKDLPAPVRVAAASALSSIGDAAATKFTVNAIEDFATRYGDRPMESMMLAAQPVYNRPTPNNTTFVSEFAGTAALLVLNSEVAQPLASRLLKCSNQMIRNAGAMAAARRWPQTFLSAGQGTFSAAEFRALQSAVTFYEPDGGSLPFLAQSRPRPAAKSTRPDLSPLGLAGMLMSLF